MTFEEQPKRYQLKKTVISSKARFFDLKKTRNKLLSELIRIYFQENERKKYLG